MQKGRPQKYGEKTKMLRKKVPESKYAELNHILNLELLKYTVKK